MKRKWIATTLAGALLLSSYPALSPQTAHAALVGEIESSVSFRTGPSTDDRRIRYLKTGETVIILEKVNSYWYKVKDESGTVGYTSTSDKYISVTETSTDAPASDNTGLIVSSVSMRTGPSTSAERIRYAQKGETVTILSKPNSYWYEVKDKFGNTGYLSTSEKYITTTYQPPAAPTPTPSPAPAPSENTGVIVSSVSLREQPSTSSTRIRYAQKGETVTILSKPNSYWYEVKDKFGNTGYLSTSEKYITTTYQPPAAPTPTPSPAPAPSPVPSENTGVIVSSVSLRTGPSTSSTRIRYVQKGETVTILSKPSNSWYEVKDKFGNTGFVSTSSKYIDADYKPPVFDPSDIPAVVQSIIDAGMKYLGTPYEYGSSRYDTLTFDCSDFVRTAFLEGAGITLPSDSRGQGDYVKDKGNTTTDWKKLKPGDIMFFMSYDGSKASDYDGKNKSNARITHDAIYLGNGQILHTYSKDSGGVRIDTIGNNHWEYRFLYGGSAL